MTELINVSGEPVVLFTGGDDLSGPPGPDEAVLVFPVDPLKPPARLRETTLGPQRSLVASGTAVPMRDVQFGPVVVDLPPARIGVAYIVLLAVALAERRRHDLVVPYDLVRDATGAIIGCRALARPL